MKIILTLCLLGFSLSPILSIAMMKSTPNANEAMLPENYAIYTDGQKVLNHPYKNFQEKIITVDNSYDGKPGCYIECFSHNKNGLYQPGPGVYSMGLVRVAGKYDNRRICQPVNYENKDISAEQSFKDLCNQKISTCRETAEGCWAGGDTGGFFGMQ